MTGAVSGVRRKARRRLLLGVSTAAALTFSALAVILFRGETTAFDAALRTTVAGVHSSSLHVFSLALSWAGSFRVLGPLAGAVALWLWSRERRRASTTAGLMSMSSVLITWALKGLFHRTRPLGAVAFPELGYSFPSGHSLDTMAIAVTFTYVLYREDLAPRWAIGAAIIFSLLVGMSRVYLDVHWATDVIGGWCLGAVIAASCAFLYESPQNPPDVSPDVM